MNMRATFLMLFLCCGSFLCLAQQNDSVTSEMGIVLQGVPTFETPAKPTQKLNNVKSKINMGVNVDSLPLPTLHSDSLVVLRKRKEVDSLKQALSLKIADIKAKGGNALNVRRQTDSLKAEYNKAISERLSVVQKKGVMLSGNEEAFLKKVNMPDVNVNTPAIPDVQLPQNGINNPTDLKVDLPSTQLPNASQPDSAPGFNDLKAPKVNKFDVPEIPGEVSEAQDAIKKVGEIGKEADDVSGNVGRLKEEGVEELKNTDVDRLTEQGVKKVDGVNAIQSQVEAAERMKQLQQLELNKIKDAQGMRDQLSSRLATNEILANEGGVSAYMDKMGKQKRKFDNLPDMRYIPKIKPNEMKERPLKDRIVPGILFQIQNSYKHVSWYLAPEVLYKLSGTFSVGAAGMYRFQYSKSPKIVWSDPFYGFKLIGQAKVYKGFYVRTEFERNSFIYPMSNADQSERIWQSNWLLGLGRTQKIFNRLSGHFWAFYNLDRDPQEIFTGRIILKTGLQFNLVNFRKKLESHVTEKMKKQREYEQKLSETSLLK